MKSRYARFGHFSRILSQFLVSLLLCCSAAQGAISAQQMRLIHDELVPAYIDGDLLTTANLTTQLIGSTQAKDRNRIDAELQRNGALKLAELSVTSRMELIRTGYVGRIAQPTEEEIVLLLKAVSDEIAKQLSEMRAIVESEGGTELEQLEDQLWKIHVSKNQIASVLRLCERGIQMARFNRSRLGETEGAERDAARDTFHQQSGQATEMLRQADERAILLRIKRIDLAEKLLQSSESFEDRLQAAWIGDLDGPIVREYFQNVSAGRIFPTKQLSVPGISESAQANVRELRALAGPELLTKSRHFFVGLHWWLRGRYGAGPHGFGLVKDQTALVSGERLFGLYMPTVMPTPTSPYDDGYQIPAVDRRHHYVWMFEYRRLFRRDFYASKKNVKSRSGPKQTVGLDRFY